MVGLKENNKNYKQIIFYMVIINNDNISSYNSICVYLPIIKTWYN
jgi:hypothetical protein